AERRSNRLIDNKVIIRGFYFSGDRLTSKNKVVRKAINKFLGKTLKPMTAPKWPEYYHLVSKEATRSDLEPVPIEDHLEPLVQDIWAVLVKKNQAFSHGLLDFVLRESKVEEIHSLSREALVHRQRVMERDAQRILDRA
ncbi:hypothetical protein GcM1_048002, partial [Golovinomyces cichoracearum]